MIETSRLKINLWSEADAKAFYELTQDQGFNSFPITKYTQSDWASASAWIAEAQNIFTQSKMGMFAVWERATNELVGIAGLRQMGEEKRVELTYRFRQSAWGKGYATEAAKAVIEYGFERLDLKEIAASITPDNADSKKVAKKLGMVLAGSDTIYGTSAEIFRVARPQKP